MNKFFLLIINRHQDILRYLIIFSAIVTISIFFPKTGIFKYEFEIGKPWKYDNLIAPFDIGIRKSVQQIDEEKEYLLEGFSPYYRFNAEVVKNEQKKFIDSFNTKLKESGSAKIDSQKCVELGLQVIDTIYSAGIISLIDEHKSFPPGKDITVLSEENLADKKLLNNFFSIKGAFDFARDSLKTANREQLGFLLPLIEQSLD